MPEPLEHQIVLDVQTALQGIAIASGYFYDVAAAAVSVDPADHIEALTGVLDLQPFLIVEVSPGRQIEYLPASRMRETIPIDITAAADAAPLVATSRLNVFQRLKADVEKAIVADVTRSGLAVDTRITDVQMGMMVGGARVLAVVSADVRVYREYGAP
jgi:hypothetical protein